MRWHKLLSFLCFILGVFLIRNGFLTTETMTFIGRAINPRDNIVNSNINGEFTNIPTAGQCLNLCSMDDNCLSFFYHSAEKFCQTHSILFSTNSTWKDRPGTKYYHIKYPNKCKSQDYIYHPRIKFCYRIEVDHSSDWKAAREDCQRDGGDLIVFDTIDKFQHINETLKANTYLSPLTAKRCFSIGAHKVGTTWFWVDGTPFNYLTNPIWTFTNGVDTENATGICSDINFHIIFTTPSRANKYICEMDPTS